MQKTETIQRISAIMGSLQAATTNPQSNPQAALAQNLTPLYDALGKSETNTFSPAWRQILSELHVEDLFGLNLGQKLRDIFERNQITFQIAANEVSSINTRLSEINKALTQVTTGMKAMKIGPIFEQTAECEIGFMIPRVVIDDDIDNLSKELHDMKFILNTFSEFTTGSITPFKIVEISTTEPFFTLSTILKIGSAFAKSVSWIIDSYKKLLDIRKSLADLKAKGVPEASLTGIAEHANTVIKKSIEELILNLMTEYKAANLAQERENELKISLELSLNRVANRIDKGFNFEVRVLERKEPNPDEEQEKTRKQTVAKIRESAKTMEFIKTPGTSLLTLPEESGKRK